MYVCLVLGKAHGWRTSVRVMGFTHIRMETSTMGSGTSIKGLSLTFDFKHIQQFLKVGGTLCFIFVIHAHLMTSLVQYKSITVFQTYVLQQKKKIPQENICGPEKKAAYYVYYAKD